MADVFLSYSSADRDAADAVQRALTAQGYDVFWDQEIPAGRDWDTWIREKLSGARVCVVLWSKNSIASANVKHEAMIALDDNRLVPAMLEPLSKAQFPMGLYLIQSVLLQDRQPDSADMQRLIAQVAARLENREPPPIVNPTPKARRAWVAPVAAAAALLVMGGGAFGAWQAGLFGAQGADPTTLEAERPEPPVAPLPKADPEPPAPTFKDFATLQHCDECPRVIVLPAGQFEMGSDPDETGAEDKEFPKRQVQVKQFAMGMYEVTFDQWEACERDGHCVVCVKEENGICTQEKRPGDGGFGRGTRPVMNVSWDQAQLYVKWLSEKSGMPYRLPTEAEWEYAARADGKAGAYFWPGDPMAACDKGNSYDASSRKKFGWDRAYLQCDDGFEGTAPVGSYPANAWQLRDMFGNISEWVQDCYAPNYLNAPMDGSAYDPEGCTSRVVRGGSWWGRPQWVRVTVRDKDANTFGDRGMGFRVAMDTTK